jgi:hypothetical protein
MPEGLVRNRRRARIVPSCLYLSEATVKAQVNRLLAKLRLRDRVRAVVLAYETGLIKPGSRTR